MAHDRTAKGNEFLLTHDFLSELLGVRRQTVSIIAGTLQRAGLISYRRGVLRVLDREGLEAASCECYEAMKHLYDRIITVANTETNPTLLERTRQVCGWTAVAASTALAASGPSGASSRTSTRAGTAIPSSTTLA